MYERLYEGKLGPHYTVLAAAVILTRAIQASSGKCIASAFVEDYHKSEQGKTSQLILSGDGANLLVAARFVNNSRSPA